MNIPSKTIIAIVSLALMTISTSVAQGNTANEAGSDSKVVATSPVLVIKLNPAANPNEAKNPPSPPENAKDEVAAIVKTWQANRGGDWIGGDKSTDINAFYNGSNWSTPSSARSEGKGYDLVFSGSKSLAQASQPLSLLDSSSLIINNGASLDLNKSIVQYSGTAALIVDAAYLEEIGGVSPIDKSSKLDLIVTNNAMINGATNPAAVYDFAGGSLLVTDSTCSLSSLTRGKVTISGYGSVEVSSNTKDVIKESAIDLTSARAQFRFIDKPVDRVISEDLDKFSVSGALPIYGSNPQTVESGDNILIRSDGGKGTSLTVVK